jgi:glycerol-3-phosphate O-acyltransferase
MWQSLTLDRLRVTLARPLIRAMVRFSVTPKDLNQLALDRGKPVFYALHVRQLSAAVVLEDAVRSQGLPSAVAPLISGSLKERLSLFFLTRSGQPSPLQRNPYEYSSRLKRVIVATLQDPSQDVQVVPVSLFWGRAPEKQDSLLKTLLADSWATPGSLRQLLRLVLHGRQTLVRFGDPVSLRDMLAGTTDPEIAVRRVGRVLRSHYKKERELAVGPNLSHRQTLVNSLIESEPIKDVIQREAVRKKLSPEAAEQRARKMAVEIASDYSYPFIRFFEKFLGFLWNRLYNGISLHRFDEVAKVNELEGIPATHAPAGIVYVPSHRSHIDYLLLSYFIFHQGLQVPHIAAGDNLNLPVLGGMLRRGGAFFLRRSFKGDPLYAAIFSAYLDAILRRGFPIEYFIEGGRSRTGKMLSPKAGMLAMTIDSFCRGIDRPLVFVPIYIGYEKLMEGDTYIAELSGKPKKKESIFGLLLTLRKLKDHYGKVHVNMGEPIALSPFMDQHWPQWRLASDAQTLTDPNQVQARRATIAALGEQVITRINDAFVLNPVNLIALSMLAAPRHAIDAERCAMLMDGLRQLLVDEPYSERQELTKLSGQEVVAYAERNGIVQRVAHPLGDILQAVEKQASLLSYFRNNVLHAYAAPALLACLIAQTDRIETNAVLRLAGNVFGFLRTELHLSWADDEVEPRFKRLIDWFVANGLAIREGSLLLAPSAQDHGSAMLHALARCIRQPLERYFIALATLKQFGSGTLSSAALEDVCFLLAQRVAFLHEPAAPEFFDRTAFRTIISTLLDQGLIRAEQGKLLFTQALDERAQDSQWLLSPDTRLAITHATSVRLEQLLAQQPKVPT